ncbi:CRISPR system precrRNA processing endoribonuclease RAMP protein Cas6 [Candidatus Oscillochloris fontis]|uniref:CRISPR system precrRNA processing endoribonuclease RAMP protein Cas6 n=1 Tax=Candidatus Oscillochloris fontis TaxID=2496868 RepID=UPI00101C2F35|nr:CRISPR system precrRNA processing endoribonuclease RAMP protein Cas6 [Candidatus Oscillochloris fontis]
MSAFPDLYAFVVELRPLANGPAPRPQGQGAQALFLDLVRQVAPDVSEALHADAQSKPYTVGILPSRRRDVVLLRVSLLQSGLFQPFVQALLRQMPGGALRLGQARLALGDVIGTPPPQGHPWASFDSFADLHARVAPAHTVTLEFASATAIGQGSRADGRQRLNLLPTPEAIFPSLGRRWNDLAPHDFSFDIEQVRNASLDTMVSHHRIESTDITLGKGPQKGFVGIVAYELPADPMQARLLTTLADAALFLGVGIKTARGMGLCRRMSNAG